MVEDPTVLIFCDTMEKAVSEKIAGIRRYAHEHGWQVHVIDWTPYRPHPGEDVFAIWHPAGVIIDSGVIVSVPSEISYMAADALLRLNLASYAFVAPSAPVLWAEERQSSQSGFWVTAARSALPSRRPVGAWSTCRLTRRLTRRA